MKFPPLATLAAVFKRVRNEDPEARRERMQLARAELSAVANRIGLINCSAFRSATVQIALNAKANDCRADLIRHLDHDGDGSVNHITSLGVHLAGIECAMAENNRNARRLSSELKALHLRLTELRASIARDVAA